MHVEPGEAQRAAEQVMELNVRFLARRLERALGGADPKQDGIEDTAAEQLARVARCAAERRRPKGSVEHKLLATLQRAATRFERPGILVDASSWILHLGGRSVVRPCDAMRRLHVRPGMTGLWQISGRSNLDWEQSIRLDLRYVDNWSPIVDLQILFRTFKAVVTSNGAY